MSNSVGLSNIINVNRFLSPSAPNAPNGEQIEGYQYQQGQPPPYSNPAIQQFKVNSNNALDENLLIKTKTDIKNWFVKLINSGAISQSSAGCLERAALHVHKTLYPDYKYSNIKFKRIIDIENGTVQEKIEGCIQQLYKELVIVNSLNAKQMSTAELRDFAKKTILSFFIAGIHRDYLFKTGHRGESIPTRSLSSILKTLRSCKTKITTTLPIPMHSHSLPYVEKHLAVIIIPVKDPVVPGHYPSLTYTNLKSYVDSFEPNYDFNGNAMVLSQAIETGYFSSMKIQLGYYTLGNDVQIVGFLDEKGILHGKGAHLFSNQGNLKSFSGTYNYGRLDESNATIQYNDGSRYIGPISMINGEYKPHGKGTFYPTDDKVKYELSYIEGKINTAATAKIIYENGSFYCGPIDENKLPNGKGFIIHYSQAKQVYERYEEFFTNGRMNTSFPRVLDENSYASEWKSLNYYLGSHFTRYYTAKTFTFTTSGYVLREEY